MLEAMYSTGGKTQSSEDLAEAAELQRPSLCGVVLAEATCERSDDHLALSLTDMAARAQQLLFGRPALLAMGLPCSGLLGLVRSALHYSLSLFGFPPPPLPKLTLQTVEGKSRKEGQEPGQVVGQCTCHARPLLCPAQGGAIFSAAVLSSSAHSHSHPARPQEAAKSLDCTVQWDRTFKTNSDPLYRSFVRWQVCTAISSPNLF